MLITNAQAVLASFDEPVAILLAVAWNPQLGDLPFGTLVTKKGGSTDLVTLAICLEQAAKMTKHITEQINTQAQTLSSMMNAQAQLASMKKSMDAKDEVIREQAKQIQLLQAKGHHEKEANGSSDHSPTN
jgi:hypothetical protein